MFTEFEAKEKTMIQEFVERFEKNKTKIESAFRTKHLKSYIDVVREVIKSVTSDDGCGEIDPERIHQIDDGDYQGTLLFVIAAKGYQPNDYWFVKVMYGSCSGCDTLQAINESWEDKPPTDDQVSQYMTLALHIVQGLKFMGETAST